MKTYTVHIPAKYENVFLKLFRKFHITSHVLAHYEKEDHAAIKWIEEDTGTDEVSEEAIFEYMKKNGVKI